LMGRCRRRLLRQAKASSPSGRNLQKACLGAERRTLIEELFRSPERVKLIATIAGRDTCIRKFYRKTEKIMQKFVAIACLALICCLAPILASANEASPFCARQGGSIGHASMSVCETATNPSRPSFKKFAGCTNWHACCCGLSWDTATCQCKWWQAGAGEIRRSILETYPLAGREFQYAGGIALIQLRYPPAK
jgi:hypothetical protein